MKYIALGDIYDGKELIKKGEEYSGEHAAQLLKSGAIEKVGAKPSSPPAEPEGIDTGGPAEPKPKKKAGRPKKGK